MNEDNINVKEILEFYVRAGVDETCGDDVFFQLNNQKVLNNIKSDNTSNDRQNHSYLAFDTKSALNNAYELCEKVSTIDELKEVIKNFEGCSLKGMAGNTVIGEGNYSAKIMFISKVPEADEDRLGKVSVGRCGQLFSNMLAAIGLNKDSCYICNILPWRPPGNRAPSDNEVVVCLPFLKKQIEIINPDIIFALGGDVVNVLSGNTDSISKLRGKWMDYKIENGKNISLMAGYHPEYFLKNPKQKAKAWSDFLRLKKKIEENSNITC